MKRKPRTELEGDKDYLFKRSRPVIDKGIVGPSIVETTFAVAIINTLSKDISGEKKRKRKRDSENNMLCMYMYVVK